MEVAGVELIGAQTSAVASIGGWNAAAAGGTILGKRGHAARNAGMPDARPQPSITDKLNSHPPPTNYI
jgi:hypothetical protein